MVVDLVDVFDSIVDNIGDVMEVSASSLADSDMVAVTVIVAVFGTS